MTHTLIQNIRSIVAMTIPVMTFQAVEFSNFFIDSVMVGRYDALLLGPVSLAGAFYALSVVFFVGILVMTGALIGQAVGAKNPQMLVRVVQSGLVLGVIFTAILVAWLLNLKHILALWFAPDLVEHIGAYLDGRVWGVVSVMVIPLRTFLVNQKLFKQVLIINFCALPINIFLNYTLIYGHFGMSELGVYGGGLATGITLAISSVLLVIFATLQARKKSLPIWKNFPSFDVYYKTRIVKLGVGLGLFITAELLLFTIINAYAGMLEPIKIAAWGVIFQLWNIGFAFTIGVGEACGIYLAELAGKRDRGAYMQGFWIFMGIITVVCVWGASAMLAFPYTFINILLDTAGEHYIHISSLAYGIFPWFMVAFFVESYLQIICRSLSAMNDTSFTPYVMWGAYGGLASVLGYVWMFVYGGELYALIGTIIVAVFVAKILCAMRLYWMTRPERIFYKVKT